MKLLSAVFIAVLVSSVLLVSAVNASKFGVQIYRNVKSDLKITSIEENNNIIAVYLGSHNTGSTGYGARARIDIMEKEQILFTGWSVKQEINPGQRKGFVIYAYKPDASNMSVRTRLYYGNEMAELEPVGIGSREAAVTKEAFKIFNFRTYDSYIRFDVASNQSVEGVLIMPQGYPGTWVFEQKRIDSFEEGTVKEIVIPYKTGFFREQNITIAFATEDGSFFQKHDFWLKRETGMMKYVSLFLDWLGAFFRS